VTASGSGSRASRASRRRSPDAGAGKQSSPEEWLARAIAARAPAARGRFARRGLAARARLDPTTQAMLLRQLSLALLELGDFSRALDVVRQAIALAVLPDVLHQDAARAALAAGDVSSALGHLRASVETAPASRRAYHFWTLGSTLLLAHRFPEAVAALDCAARADTDARPLYRGHLALARIAMGEAVADLHGTIDALAASPAGRGYGRFVLGHLAYAVGAGADARRYLESFVRRTTAARPALAIALAAELRMARATLSQISAEGVRTGLRSMSDGPWPAARSGKFDYIPGVLACRPTCGVTVQPLLGKHGKGHPSGGKS
jgi:tetratricopeptide (TPR) repeat protein